MGIGPRLPFVGFTPGCRLFRRRSDEALVEARRHMKRADFFRARRVGCKEWNTYAESFLRATCEEIKPTKVRR